MELEGGGKRVPPGVSSYNHGKLLEFGPICLTSFKLNYNFIPNTATERIPFQGMNWSCIIQPIVIIIELLRGNDHSIVLLISHESTA